MLKRAGDDRVLTERRILRTFREPEIADDSAASVTEDVRGLDVPVVQALVGQKTGEGRSHIDQLVAGWFEDDVFTQHDLCALVEWFGVPSFAFVALEHDAVE